MPGHFLRSSSFASHMAALVLALLSFVSCRPGIVPKADNGKLNAYCPLSRGNLWVYREPESTNRVFIREVTRLDTIRDRVVYIVDESIVRQGTVTEAARKWLSFGQDGKIEALSAVHRPGIIPDGDSKVVPDTGFAVLFDTEAPIGKTWLFDPTDGQKRHQPPPAGSGYEVTLEKRGSFTLSNGTTYPECVVFRTGENFDQCQYVYAKGVGLVSFDSFAPGGHHFELDICRLIREEGTTN